MDKILEKSTMDKKQEKCLDNLKIKNGNYEVRETEDCYVIFHSHFQENLKVTIISSILQLLLGMGNDLRNMPFRIKIKKEQLNASKVVIDNKINIECGSEIVYDKFIVNNEYLKWNKLNLTINIILSIILIGLFILFLFISITNPLMLIITFAIIILFIVVWKTYYTEKNKTSIYEVMK